MDRPPPQLDISDFRLLSDAEFRALPFAERLEYLKRAVEARKAINSQIEETLFGVPQEPHQAGPTIYKDERPSSARNGNLAD